MPRYDLPSDQWIELKERTELTRKEIHRMRLALDTLGEIARTEAQTIAVIANCLTNWEVRAASGEQIPLPNNGNIKQVEEFADRIPWDTWSELEDAINGVWDEAAEARVGGYLQEHVRPPQKDPQTPSNG